MRFFIIITLFPLFFCCQQKINKSNIGNEDLSGVYFKENDLYNYQLSIEKIESDIYYYQLFYRQKSFFDGSISKKQVAGVMKREQDEDKSIFYTLYTSALKEGFNLIFFNKDSLELSMDKNSEFKGFEFLEGNYTKYNLNVNKVKPEKITMNNVQEGTYKEFQSIVQDKEVYLFKYPYPSEIDYFIIKLNKAQELRVYDELNNYKPRGTLFKIYYVKLETSEGWVEGWMKEEDLKYFKYIVRYMDGEKHVYGWQEE
ncbi:hypothetical protein [Apibacter sp. HY039]|uniref:hypothetical protein n=1 Tax=Apibacter sp. HY039 TaxID=2501476 RepID=UPI000FEB6E0B|nr:hypothetical protein [Apibacter sp. HY039]